MKGLYHERYKSQILNKKGFCIHKILFFTIMMFNCYNLDPIL